MVCAAKRIRFVEALSGRFRTEGPSSDIQAPEKHRSTKLQHPSTSRRRAAALWRAAGEAPKSKRQTTEVQVVRGCGVRLPSAALPGASGRALPIAVGYLFFGLG